MIVYSTMFIISILFAYESTKLNGIRKKILFFMSALCFIVVSALRYDVGTDYFFRYVPDFNKILEGSKPEPLEPLFKLFMILCTKITSNPQIVFIITSIIINGLIFYVFYQEEVDVTYCIVLYFIGGYYFQSMNLLRQFIAVALIIISYRYLVDDRKDAKKWILLNFIAFLIHNSSLIFIISLFLTKKLISPKTTIITSVFIGLFSSIIMKVIFIIISETRFVKYQQYSGNFSVKAFIVELVTLVIVYYLYYKKKELTGVVTEKDILFVNIQVIAIFCVLLNSELILFSRILIYFSIFKIISIPYFIFQLRKIPIKNTKPIQILLITFLVILVSSMIYSYGINNDEEVLPYKSVIGNYMQIY